MTSGHQRRLPAWKIAAKTARPPQRIVHCRSRDRARRCTATRPRWPVPWQPWLLTSSQCCQRQLPSRHQAPSEMLAAGGTGTPAVRTPEPMPRLTEDGAASSSSEHETAQPHTGTHAASPGTSSLGTSTEAAHAPSRSRSAAEPADTAAGSPAQAAAELNAVTQTTPSRSAAEAIDGTDASDSRPVDDASTSARCARLLRNLLACHARVCGTGYSLSQVASLND